MALHTNRSILIWGFLKDDILACVETWISYRVIKSWRILVSFTGFFEDCIFAWWNIWISIILLLHYDTFKCKFGKATVWPNPLFSKLSVAYFGPHLITLSKRLFPLLGSCHTCTSLTMTTIGNAKTENLVEVIGQFPSENDFVM